MMINRLRLKNIRCFTDSTIEFPQGRLLFAGDIGSGKSSILHGIEFALFGLGDIDGSHLLRVGEKEANVELDFTTDGKTYRIVRQLKRGKKGVTHGKVWLEVDGQKEEWAVGELRSRILEILKFNERPNPKASSVIYRFAVFTPQKQMEAILDRNPEERLQTLRRAYSIEEYSIAAANADTVAREFGREGKFLERQAEGLSDLKKEKGEVEEEVGKIEVEVAGARIALGTLNKEIQDLDKRVQGLQELAKQAAVVEAERRAAEDRLKVLGESTEKHLDRLERAKAQGEEQRAKLLPLVEVIDPTPKSVENLSGLNDELQRQLDRLGQQMGMALGKVEDFRKLIQEGRCPTCERSVDAVEFGPRLAANEEFHEQLHASWENLHAELEAAEKLLESKKAFLLASEGAEECRRLIARISEDEQRTYNELQDYRGEEQRELTRFEELGKFLERAKEQLHLLAELQTTLERKREDATNAERLLAGRLERLTGRRTRLAELDKRIGELNEALARAVRLQTLQAWLLEFFRPAVMQIEQYMMASINQDFNALFQRWFSVLLETGDIGVRVDDAFTPLVEERGYELGLTSLSGGERTSVALAYRLALNSSVRKVSGIGGGLIILDEPTDGFSSQQLYRMREVLQELQCEQIVLVSHESELEGLADRVFRVEKIGGESTVTEA